LLCTDRTRAAQQLLPDKDRLHSDRLAYIDASHLEAYSRESWREDGTMGLKLTLMRNGFLTLALPELSAARLRRADLFISIAASREWSQAERAVIERFVHQGGVFVCTVGVDQLGPSEALLEQLGFKVGTIHWNGNQPVNGFDPLGHFKSPYGRDSDYPAFVRFHAAWPVYCSDRQAVTVTSHSPDKPVIVLRRLGRGLVVVVGDSCFAMNKNLEKASGEPFEGLRENADFWNWFLGLLFRDAE
jgi:hypothetical protein